MPFISDDPRHRERVTRIAEQVRARPEGQRLTIEKATKRHSIGPLDFREQCVSVDVTPLGHVLHHGADSVTCEGQVTIDDLLAHTLPRSAPAVMPEFRTFTVAGLISGEGVQSSSHRHGPFTNTVLAVELVTATGDVIVCSAEDHPKGRSASAST